MPAPGGRREQDRQQRQHRTDGERERRGPRLLPGAGQVLGVDGELGVEVSGGRVVFGELAGDSARGLRTQALRLVQRRELGELQLGASRSSGFSVSSWDFSESRWLDTDTYSPRAIDTAPATRPAMPAVNSGPRSVVTPGDADDEPRDRHDAVVGAEHGARSRFRRDPKPEP